MKTLTLVALSILLLAGCSRTEDNERLAELGLVYHENRYPEVVAGLDEYLEEFPESHRGWCLQGWACVQTKNFAKAEQAFDRVLEIEPRWENAHVGKAVVHRCRGNLPEARLSYQRALELLPEDAQAYSGLTLIEVMEGNFDEAIKHGEKAWEIQNTSATIPANLSVAYHYKGNIAKRDEFKDHASRLGYDVKRLYDIFEGRNKLWSPTQK